MTSIATLFTSGLLVKILTLLLLSPEETFYQTEIHRRVGGALGNVQKMLLKLQQTGLVLRTKQGNMSFYQINKRHPAYPDMKGLFLKTVAVGEVLQQNLLPYAERITLAFIYGSYARGAETAESDIDVFILGDLSLKMVAEVLGELPEQLGREVNPTVYAVKDFREKVRARNRFALELLSCPKVWLIGTEDALKAVAE